MKGGIYEIQIQQKSTAQEICFVGKYIMKQNVDTNNNSILRHIYLKSPLFNLIKIYFSALKFKDIILTKIK